MKQELQEQLYKKYPKIFRQKDLSMRETCMCWGIDTGDGWYHLLDTLCSQIQWRIDNPPVKTTNCLYNDFAVRWNAYLAYPLSDMLYSLMHKLALMISGENPKTMPTVWSNGEYEKWKNNRPKLTNWLEKQSHKIHIYFSLNIKSKEIEIPQVEATQVKEKFGRLRFYYSGGDDEIGGMVNLAEALSGDICEKCGRMDDTVGQTSGWITTICEKCVKSDEHYKNKEWKSNKAWQEESDKNDKDN